MPRQTGQTLVFGSEPNALAHPHHIFDFVFSWTWVSRPMTASYSIRQRKLTTDEHGFFQVSDERAYIRAVCGESLRLRGFRAKTTSHRYDAINPWFSWAFV